jgi:RimJ/RimL family protein N-acetyltransferase
MQNPFLIGATVYLRPLETEDAPTLVPWFNDPEVTRFLKRHQPVTLADEVDFLRRIAASPTDLVLGVALRAEDRLIGTTGLKGMDVRNHHAEFGIAIGDKTYWGKGCGTEATRLIIRHAFDTLNLNRVSLRVYEYNERALKVYQKVGFRIEGRLRQDTFLEGRYWDTVLMAVLRDEWEAVDYGVNV